MSDDDSRGERENYACTTVRTGTEERMPHHSTTHARWIRALSGTGCLLLAMATVAQAQPRWVRLSYAAGDAGTSVTVTWNADSVEAPARVEYGPTNQYGQFAESTDPPVASASGLDYVHSVTLTDLDPNTTYHYRAGGASGYSADSTFTTTPSDGCTPWSFMALGDGRSDDNSGANPKYPKIVGEALTQEPHFVVDTGDLVRDGESVGQWIDWMTKSAPVNVDTPHMVAMGNHDTDTVEGDDALYNQLFAFPRNSASNTEDYYAFTAGNAVLVSLSTVTYKSDAFAQQAQWLDDVLTQHADKTWKFVFMHHPVYTSHAAFDLGFTDFEFNHPPNEQGQNAALVPIFDKHHVDIVFAGHNHYYERFAPLAGGGAGDEGQLASGFDTGTVYMTTGGAGAFTYDDFDLFGVTIDLISWVCSDFTRATGSAICDGRHHFVRLDVDNHVLTVTTTSSTEQNLGTETPELIETFTITKANPASCTPPDPDPDTVEVVEETPDVPDVMDAPDTAPADTAAPGDISDGGGPAPDDTQTSAPDVLLQPDTHTAADTGSPPTPANTSDDGCGCALVVSPLHPQVPVIVLCALVLGFVLRRRRR